MRHKFIQALSNSTFFNRFIKSPVPQWLVFMVDISIVLISSIFVLICSSYAGYISQNSGIMILAKSGCIALLFTVSFLITGPYKSIVRLSTTHDTYRVGLAVFVALILTTIGEFCYQLATGYPFIGLWNGFIIGIMVFSLMTITRLFIKYIFHLIGSHVSSRKRVVVLGSAINSFALATALLSEADGHYNPVLLLSLGHQNINSTVNGIPIRPYNPENVVDVFKQYDCDTLLFLSTQMEFMRNGGADVFLSNHIKLLMLNQIEEFDVTEDSTPTISPHVQNIKIEDLLGRDPIITNNPEIARNIKGQTIMITGAAGSIGSEIVRQVARHQAGKIILIDQAETPMHEMQLEMQDSYPDIRIELCVADITNQHRLDRIFDRFRPRMIFHAAAYKHVPMMEGNPSEAVLTNVFGTRNLADLALKYNVDRFVMISTDKAVNPTNVMGASKRIAEIYVQSLAYYLQFNADNRSTRFITTRFGNVLGSNGSVIPLFRKQIAEGGPVTVTHRDIIRYFMTIPEACTLVLEAGCMGRGGEIFIFDMGRPIKIYDLASRMISLAGMRPDIDIKIVETGLRPGEKLFEELLNDHERILPTHHKKIMRAKVRVYDYNDVCSRLEQLYNHAYDGEIHDLVAQMKCIVPEYISQNSQFSSIDNEIDKSDQMKELTINY